ncbi:hypothetical protein [Kitasatospora sp. NBC_01266]
MVCRHRKAREDQQIGSLFGEMRGFDGDRLTAPELPLVPLEPLGRGR